MKYRREIDGLRAIAVLSVILFHAGFKLFSGGFVGVDIFFVLSGYLITNILVNEIHENKFSLSNFYERRARRILPGLFFVILCTLPFSYFILSVSDYKNYSLSLVSVVLFISNIYFYLTSGYFDIASELKPLIHTWTLGVEEQYYIFFPLLLIFIKKFKKEKFIFYSICTCIILFIISLISAQWGSLAHPSFTFYLLPTRAFELLIGALVFLSIKKFKKNSESNSLLAEFFSIIGAILILVSIFTFDARTPSPSVYSLLPTIGTSLIIIFANDNNLVGKFLSFKFLVGIGLISYSTYLWHQPVLAFAKLSNIDKNISSNYVLLLLCVTSIILGFFSWKYIEKPFRDKNKITQSQFIKLFFYFIFLFIIIGFSGYLYRQELNNSFLKELQSENNDILMNGNECFLLKTDVRSLDTNRCTTTSNNYNVLLIGDSHAASLHPELSEYLKKNDIGLSLLSSAYCLPLIEQFKVKDALFSSERCELINKKIIQTINEKKFDLIIISTYIYENGFRNRSGISYDNYYIDFMNALDRLKASNKIVMIGQFVIWTNGLPNIIAKEAEFRNAERSFDLPRYSYYGIDKELLFVENKLVDDLKKIDIGYISIIDKLCNINGCMRYVETDAGNKLIAFDYGHLTIDGSKYISNNIIGPQIINLIKNH